MSTTTTTDAVSPVRLTRQERTTMRRAAKGAALLDEKRRGWWRRVTLRDLDLENAEVCVLGQDFAKAAAALGVDEWGYNKTNGFDYGLNVLGIRNFQSHEFGFNLSDESGVRVGDEGWDFLKQCWAGEIAARRRAYRAEAK